MLYGKEREEGRKERTFYNWNILVPQKEEDTLPFHTVDIRRTRSNTGSLRTPIQAPTSVYISNTVHMETMTNEIHLQLDDFLTASPPFFIVSTPLHN